MKMNRIAASLVAATLACTPVLVQAQQNSNSNATQAQDWNTPPAGTEQAQGYKDGIEAAKLDKAANRKIDAKASHLYVHPPVKGNVKDAYRSSFEKGYQAQL